VCEVGDSGGVVCEPEHALVHRFVESVRLSAIFLPAYTISLTSTNTHRDAATYQTTYQVRPPPHSRVVVKDRTDPFTSTAQTPHHRPLLHHLLPPHPLPSPLVLPLPPHPRRRRRPTQYCRTVLLSLFLLLQHACARPKERFRRHPRRLRIFRPRRWMVRIRPQSAFSASFDHFLPRSCFTRHTQHSQHSFHPSNTDQTRPQTPRQFSHSLGSKPAALDPLPRLLLSRGSSLFSFPARMGESGCRGCIGTGRVRRDVGGF
jgi:hypothetical protein